MAKPEKLDAPEYIAPQHRVFVRDPYNYDRDYVSRETGLLCTDQSLTQQEFKEECDINVIIDRFGIGYGIPAGGIPLELYADVTDSMDIQQLHEHLRQGTDAFMKLPAHVREEFDNSPIAFMKFVERPSNYERALELGIVNPRIEAAVKQPSPPVQPAAAAGTSASLDVTGPGDSK